MMNVRVKVLFARLLLVVALFPHVGLHAQFKPGKMPKRIVFLIGDGMGLAQITGAMHGYTGVNAFERFPVVGLSKTSSSDNYVTDSGAGATVFSIGKKTFNGAIGVDSAGLPQENIFEKLRKQKKKYGTGVVATSSITHATPAAFYSHVASRKSQDDIADFLLKGTCDMAIGGGTKYLTQRKDGVNLLDSLKVRGYVAIADTNLVIQQASKMVYTLAEDGMKTMQQGRGDFLGKATSMAMGNLKLNYGNYFLMVEGSQIDWGGHDNDYAYMKSELLDFNEVINQVLDDAMADGQTLVVVTADHETGGLSLLENKADKKTFIPNYVTKSHSGIMVPVFAYGPGAELFAGTYENTAIHYKFLKLLGLR